VEKVLTRATFRLSTSRQCGILIDRYTRVEQDVDDIQKTLACHWHSIRTFTGRVQNWLISPADQPAISDRGGFATRHLDFTQDTDSDKALFDQRAGASWQAICRPRHDDNGVNAHPD
jgi:hypothetical protein